MVVQFLDVTEAAQFLRVRPATLYAWVHERKIPYRKHGSRLVFRADELEGWSERQAVRPVSMGRAMLAPTGTTRRSLKTREPTADRGPDSLSREGE
jgi:excisionase family DNA binding protein